MCVLLSALMSFGRFWTMGSALIVSQNKNNKKIIGVVVGRVYIYIHIYIGIAVLIAHPISISISM
jgi:hypothetical protein